MKFSIKNKIFWTASLLFFIGIILRIWQLPEQIIADDEWHAIYTLIEHDPFYIFTHFGLADHCIPLTLYYDLLANTIGLSEWGMRLPLLIAGVVTIVAVPWMLSNFLSRAERLVLTGLIALSPLAVYFSRIARPYSLSLLLSFTALWTLLHWWRSPSVKWALVYVICTAWAAWLLPVSLVFTGAGLIFITGANSINSIANRSWRPLINSILLGTGTVLPLLALLGPPIMSDWQSLSGKMGTHSVQLSTLIESSELFAGTPFAWIAILWLLIGIIGIATTYHRDRASTLFWLWVLVLPPPIIALSHADWIDHALVFTRYNLQVLLVFSMFVAVGMVKVTQPLGRIQKPILISILLALFLQGPIPSLLATPNQFTGHMCYQFDYNQTRNIYTKTLEPKSIPEFYKKLGETPNRYTIIEAPWYLEWQFDQLNFFQAVHHQKVMIGFLDGLCTGDRYGEYPIAASNKLLMKYFVFLNLLTASNSPADFLVIHRQPPPGAPVIPELHQCIDIIKTRFGSPVFEGKQILVFNLRPISHDVKNTP